ncbi:putative DUF2225 domain-containing protein [Candidatus Magnetomoraceae bacterium gMMP-15]
MTTNNAQSNPFLKTSIQCPICGQKDHHRRIKARFFTEQNKEVDLRPAKIMWLSKDVATIHPPLYYMWHCSNCYFTAGYPFFKEPVKGCKIGSEEFAKKFRASCENEQVKMIIDRLTANIDIKSKSRNLYHSLKLHLLAIFELQLIKEIAEKDAMNLGRYCLRLAWLYRDINENKETKKKFVQQIEKLITSIKADWQKIPDNEETALKMAVDYYKTTLISSFAVKSSTDENNIVLLIARIYMKLNNIPEARTYLERSKDIARKADEKLKEIKRAQSLQAKQGGGEVSGPDDQELMKMNSDIRKMRLFTREVQDLFDIFRETWEKDQIEKANAILKEHGANKTPLKRREILVEHGIDQRIANRLVPVQNKKKKKGLFGLFG